MKTHVEFRSSKFPPYEREEDEINPGIWGKRLAEYLITHLNRHGIKTFEMVVEDWGYYIPIASNDRFRLAVCCGHQSGDDDEFLIFTDPSTPKVKKFFRTIDATQQLAELVETLRHILESDPDISEVRWRSPQ